MSEKKGVLSEFNDGVKKRKRQHSYSPECLNSSWLNSNSKRWKSDFEPTLLEEMGVSMIEDAVHSDGEKSSEDLTDDKSDTQKLLTHRGNVNKENVYYNKNKGKNQDEADIINSDDSNDEKPKDWIDNEPKNGKLELLKPSDCRIQNSKIISPIEGNLNEKMCLNEKTCDIHPVNNNNGAAVAKAKSRVLPDDDGDFIVYKCSNREDAPVGDDYFKNLSDEMILTIFSHLQKKHLVNCALVSKRFLRIAYDESLWTRMDLSCRNLPPNSIYKIFKRGLVVLRFAQTVIPDPVHQKAQHIKNYSSKVQYLDLSMAQISSKGLAELLRLCRSIKKLSLENCDLDTKCCIEISKNVNLEVLNLTLATGITPAGLDAILSSCPKIQSLNLAWTSLSTESLDILACKVPACLERLNISGCRKNLKDEHVIEILHRCEDMLELDLSDCLELTDNCVHFIANHINRMEHLSLSRCYAITMPAFLSLKQVESLMFLDVFSTITESELNELKSEMPEVGINQFLFSSIARPTVGLRRTSIWGLKVRD